MANLPHSKPDMATLKAQLNRLYRRQLVLDELIRLLERYAASERDARPRSKKLRPK
jgi:hypothetical protein